MAQIGEKGVYDLTGLTFSDVEAIFRKTEWAQVDIYYAAIILGMVLGIIRVIYTIQKITLKNQENKGASLSISDFFQLILQKWYFGLVILAIPMLFTGIDSLLAVLFGSINESFGTTQGEVMDKIKKELILIAKNEPSIFDLSLGDLIDYTASLAIQPFVILIDEWIYSLALFYRFYFLGLLKMTSGFAIVSLLNQETKQMFFTWLKGLLVCYLLIPAFIFANNLMENVKEIYLANEANFEWYTSILILIITGKILLFTSSKILLWRVL